MRLIVRSNLVGCSTGISAGEPGSRQRAPGFFGPYDQASPATLPLFRRARVIYSNAWGEGAATGSP